jgi:hypothetical protein
LNAVAAPHSAHLGATCGNYLRQLLAATCGNGKLSRQRRGVCDTTGDCATCVRLAGGQTRPHGAPTARGPALLLLLLLLAAE